MKDQTDKLIYYPMLVSDPDTAYDGRAFWEAFQKLSQQAQDILTSQEMPVALFRIQQEFEFDDSAIIQLSRLIRWLFFEQISWEDFSVRIESLLLAAHGDAGRAKELLGRIGTDILNMQPTPYQEEVQEDTTASQEPIISDQIREMPLLKALTDYPDLHNQRVTEAKIQIKSERDPVAPTVRNWLRAYRDALGVGRHNTVDRGKFLFQTENTKDLIPGERERVSLLVKSLDDDEPIRVHLVQKKILFPEIALAIEKPAPTSTVNTPVPTRITPPSSSVETTAVSPETTIVPQLGGKKAFPEIPDAFTRISPSFSQADTDHAQLSQPTLRIAQPNPVAIITPDSLEFSSNHVLPGEQDAWDAKQ